MKYQEMTAEQKLDRSRKNYAARLAKHGIEKIRSDERIFAKRYREKADKRVLHAKWERAYRRARPAYKLLRHAKERARELGLPFDIVEADIQVPVVCPVLGIALVVGNGRQHDGSPSIDRIIPSLGYVKGNIAVISLRANRIKQNASPEELEAVAAWVRVHRCQ